MSGYKHSCDSGALDIFKEAIIEFSEYISIYSCSEFEQFVMLRWN